SISAALALALLLSPILVDRLAPAGIERAAFARLARWAWPAGPVLLAGVGSAALLRRRARANARPVEGLGRALVASFALLLCGSGELAPLTRGPSLAPSIRAALEPDEPFYCVGMYLQTLPFALGRTCVIAAYHGEFELQFDPDGRQHIRSLDAFAD